MTKDVSYHVNFQRLQYPIHLCLNEAVILKGTTFNREQFMNLGTIWSPAVQVCFKQYNHCVFNKMKICTKEIITIVYVTFDTNRKLIIYFL